MSMIEAPLLVVDGVQVQVGGRRILDAVQLSFAAGSVTALVGPNGAGKSTLLSVIAGDQLPAQGQVRLLGKPLPQWRAKPLARERAVMPQDHAVRFAFGVREVVAMGRLPYPADPQRDHELIEAAMDQADLLLLGERDVQTLSGGEAARTALARVLAQDTVVLLLDEPTAALDLRHQERTLRSVRRLADAGACVVVVLHDLNLAAGYADRVVMLAGGQVVADGAPRAVLTRDTIERVYGVAVQVIEHPTRGVPLVVVD